MDVCEQRYLHGWEQPVDLALADLNGDGKLDVTVANSADNTLQVF